MALLGALVKAKGVPLPRLNEHQEQTALFAKFTENQHLFPELAYAFAVPNAAKRSPQLAHYLHAEGLKAGVPDVWLPVARNGWHGLVLELKVKPNKPSEAQLGWLHALVEQGYLAEVVYGCEAAWALVSEYLRGEL